MMRVAFGSPKARSFWIMVSVASLVLAFVVAVFLGRDLIHKEGEREAGIEEIVFSRGNRIVNISRKLLLQSSDKEDMNRIGTACSKDDIVIYQAQVAPLPSGIPSYTVQIMNMCASDCSISSIHVHCGWFSSARLINPRVFRRLGYDDCLVNDGHALSPGRTLSFQYANTYRYPLSVSSVVCRS